MSRFLFSLFLVLICSYSYSQEVVYSNCDGCWNADSLGNHRAVVYVDTKVTAVKVTLPWRRNDLNPENKRIIVEAASTHAKVMNVAIATITREYGAIYFEPEAGEGLYYIYYMPYKNEGRSNYPKGVYLKPENTASGEWSAKYAATPSTATLKEFQSINSFNSFYPMELIATRNETEQLKAKSKDQPFLLFPEDRMHPVKMRTDLPYRWIKKGISTTFTDTARRGEFMTFQIGVWALKEVENITIRFSDLVNAKGQKIPSSLLECINTDGITYDNKPIKARVDISQGNIQPLWCAVDFPETMLPGTYSGTATISSKGTAEQTIRLSFVVTDELAKEDGIAEPWKMTRVKWLNSTLAQSNSVVAPYTPLVVTGNSISLLGRKIVIGKDGLPQQVQTFFTPEMTSYSLQPKNILSNPIRFIAIRNSNDTMKLLSAGIQFIKKEPGTVSWKSTSSNKQVQLEVVGSIEFDGFVTYSMKLTAKENVSLNDIQLQMPFDKKAATYMMGLGEKGGYRQPLFEWKWNVAQKNQDGCWIGDVNAGMQYSLRDENYVRPLNTNFYLQKPLLLPSSWGNDGNGGISIIESGNQVMAKNYSGARTMQKGDVLYYNFTLLITPFHTINTDFQWKTRFYHKYQSIDSVKPTGATVVNIHHANAINPWINYPFIEHEAMKKYIDEAHSKGIKVKIYNTVRELSNHAYETPVLRSLGHEIYSTGKGGGFSWLQEHVGDDYIAAWFVPEIKDAAIVNSGMSRWHNYYVEGMNWLTRNIGIDGIYLDDVAFDRITMKRVKRVLTNGGKPGIIDLHSANQFNKNDGFNNSANLYMEHFPYLNRLWFGEYFDYEKGSPDFFLTEISGIPFGLMGEMLEGGGNPWRGMVFGMTSRMPWSEKADPRPLWKAWDDFGMQGTSMIGWWSGHCPVTTDNSKVLTTVYQKKGAALVALASWADTDMEVSLNINWKKLGIDPGKASITATDIRNFQEARTFKVGERIPVKKGEGWLLTIR